MSENFIAGFTPPPDDNGPAWWFIYCQDKFLVTSDDPPRLPLVRQISELGLTLEAPRYLGLWQGRPAYATSLPMAAPAPQGHEWHGLYGLAMGWPEERMAFLVRPGQAAFGLGATATAICGVLRHPHGGG